MEIFGVKMRSTIFHLILIFCVASVNCGLVSWFQEWSETLNPSVLLGNRSKRATEHTENLTEEESHNTSFLSEEANLVESTTNRTEDSAYSNEEDMYTKYTPAPREKDNLDKHITDHTQEITPSTEEDIDTKKNASPTDDECQPNNEEDKLLSLLDIEEESNGNKHAQEEKQHSKRCPRVRMASPKETGFPRVGSSLRSNPTVGLVRRDVPNNNKRDCEICRANPICKFLKECNQCNDICSAQLDNEVVGSVNPMLISRLAENQDKDSGKQRIYSFANFSEGAEKEIICRILRINNTTDIDTVYIYISTKSNEAPQKYIQHANRKASNTTESGSPTLQRRFGEDYDYPDNSKFITPSKSGKNPDIIEGPPPSVGNENPLIVEPEGLDDSDSNETLENLNRPSKNSANSKSKSRIGGTNAPALPIIAELTKKQEQHLADINNAIREAKEMIQTIHSQAKLPSTSNPSVGSNNIVDPVNLNSIRNDKTGEEIEKNFVVPTVRSGVDGNLGEKNTMTEINEIATKPSKEVIKAKLRKYLNNLKKQKNSKLPSKKLAPKTENKNLSDVDPVPVTLGSRNDVEQDSRVETTTSNVKATLRAASILPNVEEKIQKERDELKNRLKMFLEEQKNKTEIKSNNMNPNMQKSFPPQEILNVAEKTNDEESMDSSKKPTATHKDLLKERLNKFVEGLKSSPIKNDLKLLSKPGYGKVEQRTGENIVGSRPTDKPNISDHKLTELSSNLQEISDHTDQLKEKLRMFIENNNQNIGNRLGSMPQNPEDQNQEDSFNNNAGNMKDPSEAQNLIEPANNLARDSLREQVQLKPKTDFLEKLRAANEQIAEALKPKNLDLPKFTPKSSLSNELKRAKLREKLEEYVNSLHSKVPKLGSPEKSSADKYGKGIFTALKENESKLNENNDVGPKLELNNRLQKFDENVKADNSKILSEKSGKPLGNPSKNIPTVAENDNNKDFDGGNLGSRGNFIDEESLAPWSNNLGKIVKSAKDELFFIGDGIKLPLRMTNKSDGTIDLSVDLEKLCSCNNSSCPKNPAEIEHTVGVILEKEAELQKELNSNLASSKKHKRSPKVNHLDNSMSNTLGDAESKLPKHRLFGLNQLQDSIHQTTEDSNKIVKSTSDDSKPKYEQDERILKELDEDIEDKVHHLFDKTLHLKNIADPIKNTVNNLKQRLNKENDFIHKFKNKLSKEHADLEANIESTLNEAQDSILNPYRPLEKKIEDLDNEIRKENQKREELLAEESKKWVGDEDINKAVKQETSIIENVFNWYRSVAPGNIGLLN